MVAPMVVPIAVTSTVVEMSIFPWEAKKPAGIKISCVGRGMNVPTIIM